jgi:hypothetical protein
MIAIFFFPSVTINCLLNLSLKDVMAASKAFESAALSIPDGIETQSAATTINNALFTYTSLPDLTDIPLR